MFLENTVSAFLLSSAQLSISLPYYRPPIFLAGSVVGLRVRCVRILIQQHNEVV